MKRLAMVLLVLVACKGEKSGGEGQATGEDQASKKAPAKSDKQNNKDKPSAKNAIPDTIEELEIEFYLQPDGTGDKTENKELRIRRGKLEITEANVDGITTRINRDVTKEEMDALVAFAKARYKGAEGSRPDHPRVEFELEIGELEHEEHFPKGKVPAELVEFQKKYFKEAPFE